MPNRFYIPDKTWVDLGQKPNFEKFIKAYFDLLQKKLQQVEGKGNDHSYSYYTCGKPHDPRNPEWKQFKILWQLCKKNGYDVHHIDYDKFNNCVANLITLCRSCHAKTNFNRESWIEYFKQYNLNESN